MRQRIPTWQPFSQAAEALSALGVERAALPVEEYDNGPHFVMVGLESKEAVASLEPDLARLNKLGVFGFSTFAGEGTKWKTRMFGPGVGVAEDPATGSAAGPLGVHLLRNGLIESGEEIELTQGVEIQRPSALYVRIAGTPDQIESVEVGGEAVIVANGELQL
jgi:trans-2,3-dihydro-3-hydroxyanthranilate isomerase